MVVFLGKKDKERSNAGNLKINLKSRYVKINLQNPLRYPIKAKKTLRMQLCDKASKQPHHGENFTASDCSSK